MSLRETIRHKTIKLLRLIKSWVWSTAEAPPAPVRQPRGYRKRKYVKQKRQFRPKKNQLVQGKEKERLRQP